MSETKTAKLPVVSVVLEQDLLVEVDKVAKSLDMNRSQYFRSLARKDIRSHKLDQPLLPAEKGQEVPA